MTSKLLLVCLLLSLNCCSQPNESNYYFHPELGNDQNNGTNKSQAFKSLKKLNSLSLKPGDTIFLASGTTFKETLLLTNISGKKNNPIVVTSVSWDNSETVQPAVIDFKNFEAGIHIEDASFINISNIKLTGNGYDANTPQDFNRRCGILLTNKAASIVEHIYLDHLEIFDVFYENKGFVRGLEEVKTANGTQKYGWGIRVINQNENGIIKDITLRDNSITSVAHTGIKLTGNQKNISNIIIENNEVSYTGGPGIQMSEVKNVHVLNNLVTHSGSYNDTRKWGRGSGLWTWGSDHVLIEKNKFMYANGPGDSAGVHIDFNCNDIVIQYNLSAHNAGGFCEILGNNYNCVYRYNVSINDGHRIKGENGAFQEGKLFWLSGYQGNKKPRKGPVNSYFYNNTMYVDETIISKFAVDNTSKGILIANNIFYLLGDSKMVKGDQYVPDNSNKTASEQVFFKHNLFLSEENWPNEIGLTDETPFYGNPEFLNAGGLTIEDYLPKARDLVKQKGILINPLPEDDFYTSESLQLKTDILGNDIGKTPSLGALEPK